MWTDTGTQCTRLAAALLQIWIIVHVNDLSLQPPQHNKAQRIPLLCFCRDPCMAVHLLVNISYTYRIYHGIYSKRIMQHNNVRDWSSIANIYRHYYYYRLCTHSLKVKLWRLLKCNSYSTWRQSTASDSVINKYSLQYWLSRRHSTLLTVQYFSSHTHTHLALLYLRRAHKAGFRHPSNTQKTRWVKPMKKTHTKLNSTSVCHASNN